MVPSKVMGSSKLSVVSSDGLMVSVSVSASGGAIAALVYWLSVWASRFASLADME